MCGADRGRLTSLTLRVGVHIGGGPVAATCSDGETGIPPTFSEQLELGVGPFSPGLRDQKILMLTQRTHFTHRQHVHSTKEDGPPARHASPETVKDLRPRFIPGSFMMVG